MTRILARDPARRCKKLNEWPAVDRALWEAALKPDHLLEAEGSRAGYKLASNRMVAAGYGRWLAALEHIGSLDTKLSPGERITPAGVKRWIKDMLRLNRRFTVLSRLAEFYEAALVMGPDRDWQWIRRLQASIRAMPPDNREKKSRLVDPAELFELGLHTMAEAAGTPRQKAIRIGTAC